MCVVLAGSSTGLVPVRAMNLERERTPLLLKFVHITKTGGTEIETHGKARNLHWGRFHHEYGWWHELFPNKPAKLKEKYDWFVVVAVVRNPYARAVSEFHDSFGGQYSANTTKDAAAYNTQLRSSIRRLSGSAGNHPLQQRQRRLGKGSTERTCSDPCLGGHYT